MVNLAKMMRLLLQVTISKLQGTINITTDNNFHMQNELVNSV